jgi:hypothetical protein
VIPTTDMILDSRVDSGNWEAVDFLENPSPRLPGLSYPNLFRIQVLSLAWCSSSGVAQASLPPGWWG